MTNPDNAIGTNGAYNGRTSVEAFNDIMGIFESRGVLSGWECAPSSGMTVALGGVAGTRDVAVAEDASGNFTSIDNRSGSPVEVTLSAAPASNSRIDSIVAYVTNPPEGDEETADNPMACGIIAVSGTASSTPSAPGDSAIRTAITGDGGSGSTAFYVVLANITVGAGTTDITSDAIEAGASASFGPSLLPVPQTFTPTKNSTYVGSINTQQWVKYGRLVVFSTDFNTAAIIPSGSNVLFTGMPAPAADVSFSGVSNPATADVKARRFRVTTAGTLTSHYNGSNTQSTQIPSGVPLQVSGAYFVDE